MEVEGRVEFHSHYQQRSDVPASCTHRFRQIRISCDSTIFEPAGVVQVSFLQRTGQGLCPNPLGGVLGNVSRYKQIENGYMAGKGEFDSFPSSICRKFNY